MTEKRPSRALYWVYTAGILFGTAIVIWQTAAFETQKASFQWPVASGTILQSARTLVSGRDSNYRADISYSYKVGGKGYVSDQISLWSSDLRDYDNRAFVSSHRAGAIVDVYYDPAQPQNAVLIPGPNEKISELLTGLGGFCIVSSTWGIFRRRRRQPRLYALLNAPDAQTRTIHLRKTDIEKGVKSFTLNFLVAGFFMMFATAFIPRQLFSVPNLLLEAPHPSHTWFPIAGAACVLGFILFLARALQKARSAQCPLCGNLLNKKVYSEPKCNECGTRIILDDGNPTPNRETA